MENTNLENLNRLAKLFGTDRLISSEDIQEIRSILIGVLANNKKEVESLTEETKQAINAVLDKVLTEHDTYLEKTKQMAQEVKSDTTEAIKSTMDSLEEVKRLCKEVMESKPVDGKDADEEKIVSEVLAQIKLPEYKEVMLDDGGQIVDKINSLPVNEENQIDAKHIKNLPEFKNGRWSGITKGAVLKLIEENAGAGTMAIGAPITSATAGSILFTGASGELAQDNAKLFFDDTNKRLGIGTATLTSGKKLTVAEGTMTNNQGGGIQITGDIAGFVGSNGLAMTLTNSTSTNTGFLRLDRTTASAFIGMTLSSTSRDGIRILTHSSSPVEIARYASTFVKSSGTDTAYSLTPNINQSSTAGYTTLLINPTETTTGSGAKLLADFQVGGVSKFNVANTGITTITNTTDTASNQIFNLKGARATPTTNDEVYQSFSFNNSVSTIKEFGRITTVGATITSASEQGRMFFATMTAGTLTNRVGLYSGTLFPVASNSTDLGGTGNQWANLFLGSGKKIDFNNGNATVTHSTGLLTSNVPIAAPQIYNADLAATVTTNTATITRASRNNTFTNSSAASMTITLSTTSAAAGDILLVQVLDFSAAAQTITWVNTEDSAVSAPTISNGSTTLPLTAGFKWNPLTNKWRCMMSV